MNNPYSNGRKTSKGSYQKLHDPTEHYTNTFQSYESPYNSQYTYPEPVYDTAAASSSSFANPNVSGAYVSAAADQHSVGAQRVPSRGPSRVPSYREMQQESMPAQTQNFPMHSMPTQSAPVQMPEVGAAEPPSVQVPWDASAVGADLYNPETTLISNGGNSSRYRPQAHRRSSIATSFRRYFDPESQESSLYRRPSTRSFFSREPDNEYADEEDPDYQIPISGDDYAVNTWEPSDPYAQRTPMSGQGVFEDYNEAHDLSHGYEDFNSVYDRRLGTLAEGDEDEFGAEKDETAALAGQGYNENNEDNDGEDGSYNGVIDEKGLRTVELFRGNLVLDCPVSTQLLDKYPDHRPVREFTHMRYTAATCDPSGFQDEQYTLRQMCYTQPRQTELFICVTIYNEDDLLLARTLQGVFNNIRHLCHRDRSTTWGPEGWKKVVVCVVADGRNKLHPRAKALMAALGAYQEGFAKNMVNDKAVEAHIYEYTSMVRIKKVSEKEGVKLTTEKATPVQLMFCMKERNAKKINSHRWFFQAFSEILKPNVCVLLDAGTRPGNHAIYHLWKSFDRNPQVGGACGEIAAMLGPGSQKLINPLVAAQNFEYKMSNILDKPSESMFGFITVLPGAFSAYRFSALQNHPSGNGPLEKYFKGEKLEGKGGVFQANMYLAEDRILCWELVAKRHSNWILSYVKNAKAHTDVPERLPELVLQRRRWLNGAFFAQVYSLAHCFGIWGSGHSIGRKLAFHIQFLYQAIALTFSWFSLANFFLVFHILSAALGSPSAEFAPGKILGVVLTWVYAACIITIFILSFGNRPQGTRFLYDGIVVFFALMMAYMIFCTIYISVKGIEYAICANGGFTPKLLWSNSTFRDLIVSLLATYALYLLISLLFLDPWHVLTSMVQYTLLSPAYVNVLNVYAFCNTHDISWGTKGDTALKLDLGVVRADDTGKLELELPTSTELVDKYYLDEVQLLSTPPEPEKAPKPSDSDKKQDYYALFRSVVVLVWVLMNLALVAVVLNIGGFQNLLGNDTSSSSSSSNSAASSLTARFSKRASGEACREITTGGNKTSQIYMAVIFWSVAAMAAYRAVLSVAYLFTWMFRRV